MLFNGKVGLEEELFRIYTATDMSFPYHIHMTYELIFVTKGSMKTVIDGKEYRVAEGRGVLVFPLQYHSFEVNTDSQIQLFVFSPTLVPEFHTLMQGKLPACPILQPEYSVKDPPTDGQNVFAVKSFFYRLCGELGEKTACVPSRKKVISLIDKIFLYVDRCYAEECTLKTLSNELKYDYYYLSKLFKEKTGITFNSYLNRYRINRACYLLTNTAEQITEIAISSGFGTIRTFNREFLLHKGVTPQAYRNAN